MRTIRFRAKPCYKVGKQSPWVYGTFQYIAQRRVKPGATDNGTCEPRSDKGRIIDLYGSETEVLCDTVGQFTSLRDINGKDIYEGDILEVNYADEESYLEVRFVRGVFAFLGMATSTMSFLAMLPHTNGQGWSETSTTTPN